MTKYLTLIVAGVAICFCGCQKEDVNGTMTNSTTSSGVTSNATTTFQPSKVVNYGALIGTPSTTTNVVNYQISVANMLGISCIRARVVVPGSSKLIILNQ